MLIRPAEKINKQKRVLADGHGRTDSPLAPPNVSCNQTAHTEGCALPCPTWAQPQHGDSVMEDSQPDLRR